MSKSKIILQDEICEKKGHFFKNLLGLKIHSNFHKELPYGWHWLYFNEDINHFQLGNDGHPKRGSFFPKLVGYKRMWAGSEIEFLNPIKYGFKIKKTSYLENIEKKGKNKNIFLAKIKHLYKKSNKVLINEIQNIVFVRKNYLSKKKYFNREIMKAKLLSKKKYVLDNIMLFRYSALTYNSHKIHYDLEYTRNIEGYDNLLCHGPLLATLILNQISFLTRKKIKNFSFRAIKPVFVNEKFEIFIYKSCLEKHYEIVLQKVRKKETAVIAKATSF